MEKEIRETLSSFRLDRNVDQFYEQVRILHEDFMANYDQDKCKRTCDRLFIEGFVTDQMANDFPLIARDFFMHEYKNINNYNAINYYLPGIMFSCPYTIFEQRVMSMIMNAARSGSKFAAEFIVNLHKIYYRKEYQQLKRFTRISIGEITALVDVDDDDPVEKGMIEEARILTVLEMRGVTFEENCSIIYYLIDHKWNQQEEQVATREEETARPYEIYKQKIDEMFPDKKALIRDWLQCETFAYNIVKKDVPSLMEYEVVESEIDKVENYIANAFQILENMAPDLEYNKAQLLQYAHIYSYIKYILNDCKQTNDILSRVVFGNEREDSPSNSKTLYTPIQMKEESAEAGKKQEVTKSDTKETLKTDQQDTSYIEEIESLRRKVLEQNGIIQDLKDTLETYKAEQEESRKEKEQSALEHEELVKIREYLYNLTEEDTNQQDTVSLEEIKEYLNEKRIVVVGGHINWQQKIKKECAQWSFIDASAACTLRTDVLRKADFVYFFTDTLAHGVYYKYMNALKESNVKFGYIHGVNVENTLRKMYTELKENQI